MTATSRPATPVSFPALRRAGRAELLFAAGLNAVLIGGMWVRHGGLERVGTADGLLTGIGQLAALYGTALALLQLALVGRVPWLERWFGQDRLLALHRWLGFATTWLLVAHVVATTAGFALTEGTGLPAQLVLLVTTQPWVLAAAVAFALFVMVAVTSIRAARRALSYETWHGVHLYAYLALILGFGHQVAIGSDLTEDPVARAYWIALYAAAFASIAAWRVGVPVVRSLRHRLWVSSVVPEADGVVSIYLRGRDLDRLPVRSGQFLVVRFLAAGWWRGHPFSISAQPNGQWLRITVKDLGDDSARYQRLAPGTRVVFEGPYGVLTAERAGDRDVLLIAGGVGVAPLRALAEELSGMGRRVTMLIRASRPADVCFRAEMRVLADRRGVVTHELVGRRDDPRFGGDPLAPGLVAHLVPDVAARAVYVCGPDGLMDAAHASLRALGVPDERIHDERFAT